MNDIEIIKPYFNLLISRTCDFTIGGMFMWRDYFNMDYIIDNNTFFSRVKDRNGNLYFNLPVSTNIENSLLENIRNYYQKDTGIKFNTIPEEYIELFLKICPRANIIEQTDYFDYIYSASDLISLTGSKYHSQRNLIAQFKRNNPNWKFVNLNLCQTSDLIDFFNLYTSQATTEETAIVENKMTLEILENLNKYNLIGGILLVDKKIVGFSLGEIIKDTLFIHTEKADKNYKGSYQTLTVEFAKLFGSSVDYINREEDMGDLGLRKAKMSYHPISLLKKYIVEVH